MSVRGLSARQVRRPTALVSITSQTVRISGVLREIDTDEWLSPLLSDVHEQAVAHALPEVVLDLRDLTYANAALWKCISSATPRSAAAPSADAKKGAGAWPGWRSLLFPSQCS
jgi:hypothetical protein